MEKQDLKVSKKEYNRLLEQCIIFENLLSKLKSNDYKLDVSNPVVKNLYDQMHEDISEVIRVSSKKMEREHKKELKSKKQ
jgi:hypothetical protein